MAQRRTPFSKLAFSSLIADFPSSIFPFSSRASSPLYVRGSHASNLSRMCERPAAKANDRAVKWSMSEMAHAGEDHRQTGIVGGRDDLGIAERAAGLDHR